MDLWRRLTATIGLLLLVALTAKQHIRLFYFLPSVADVFATHAATVATAMPSETKRDTIGAELPDTQSATLRGPSAASFAAAAEAASQPPEDTTEEMPSEETEDLSTLEELDQKLRRHIKYLPVAQSFFSKNNRIYLVISNARYGHPVTCELNGEVIHVQKLGKCSRQEPCYRVDPHLTYKRRIYVIPDEGTNVKINGKPVADQRPGVFRYFEGDVAALGSYEPKNGRNFRSYTVLLVIRPHPNTEYRLKYFVRNEDGSGLWKQTLRMVKAYSYAADHRAFACQVALSPGTVVFYIKVFDGNRVVYESRVCKLSPDVIGLIIDPEKNFIGVKYPYSIGSRGHTPMLP